MWQTADASELKTFTDQIGNGVMVIEVCPNHRFRVLSINHRIEEVSGLKHGKVSGFFLEELLPAAVAEQVAFYYRRCVEEARPQEYEETLKLPKGRLTWHTVLTPLSDRNGRVVRLLASTLDFTARHQLEAELRHTAKALHESESRLHAAVRGAELGIWDWDVPAGRLWIADDWVPALQTFEVPTTITLQQWVTMIHPDDRTQSIAAGKQALSPGTGSYIIEHRFQTLAQGWKWRHVHGTVTEYDDAGNPTHICGTHRDITQQKKDREQLARLTAELEYRAAHDSLTGALNRGSILDELEKEIARAQREGTTVTVALLDADHFKIINDTHGHQVGDETLQELALRIREVLRPYDHLGRYGGEEFLVVTQASNGAAELHERIRRAVASAPFATSAGKVNVTISIGVATGSGDDTGQLIDRADQALYRAKRAGRNRVIISDGRRYF